MVSIVEPTDQSGAFPEVQSSECATVLHVFKPFERAGSTSRSTSAGSGRSVAGSVTSSGFMAIDAQAEIDCILKSSPVEEWQTKDFEEIRFLMSAPANRGHVSIMKSLSRGGQLVAVKKMPNQWARKDHAHFVKRHPKSREQPWLDVAITTFLHNEGYPYLCEPLGVYKCSTYTYVVSSLASRGDLFGAMEGWPCPGRARELEIRPLMHQVVSAVGWLHNVGIVHRDLSLENIVLAVDQEGNLQAKLIDFGMASLNRFANGTCGKSVFEAPEMHDSEDYDAFLTDAFAIGVVAFAMATCDYPWIATRPGQCKMFEFISEHGLRKACSKRCLKGDKKKYISEVISEPLMELIEGLLDFDPHARLTIGETCWSRTAVGNRRSVFDCAWLHDCNVQ